MSDTALQTPFLTLFPVFQKNEKNETWFLKPRWLVHFILIRREGCSDCISAWVFLEKKSNIAENI